MRAVRKIPIIISAFFILIFVFAACSGNSSEDSSVAVSQASVSFSVPIPSFGTPAGLYTDEFALEIVSDGKYTVRYTLDGTEPDLNSPEYTSPVTITDRSSEDNDISTITGISTTGDYVPSTPVLKGTVVKAASFTDDGKRSPTVTSTYFVGLDFKDTLVVSIVTDRDGLFSYENGIFMLGKRFDDWKKEVGSKFSQYGDWEYQGNFSQKGSEWEREINIEFFENNKLVHSQTAGMRVAGAATRTYKQKSLRITARSQYGEKYFNYDLIHGNKTDGFSNEYITRYRSFVLRNGGNDSEYSRIRDPFIQQAVSNCSFSTQQTRAAVAFINGEFWGVYTVTEDYNDRYIQENYGVDNDNVAMIKKGELEEGSDEDINLFYDVQNFIISNDMSIEENYIAAGKMIDLEGLAQYCALNLYIGSDDGPFHGNNWRAWRAIETSDAPYHDGQIRLMVYDTEFSLGLYDNGRTYDENSFEILEGNTSYIGSIFNSLMNNEHFKNVFIDEFLKMRNERFSPSNSQKIIDNLCDEYMHLMYDHYIRFGSSAFNGAANADKQFIGKTDMIMRYIKGRYETAPYLLCQYLGLDPETAIITDFAGKVSLSR